jgi:hypothetical protein
MKEDYSNKATKYAEEQRNIAENVNSTNAVGTTYESPTNSIPPDYKINGIMGADNNGQHDREDVFNSIFNKSNIVFIIWFLAIYFIAYLILGFFFNKGDAVINYQLRLSRTIDIICLFCLLIIIISAYASYTDYQKKTIVQNTITDTSDFVNDPMSIFSMLLFIVCFYIVVYLFRIPMDRETKPITISIIEAFAWILFVIIIFVDFFKYVLGISFTALLAKLFDWSSLPDDYIKSVKMPIVLGNLVSGNVVSGNVISSKPIQMDEVFNISNNLYTYDDAQSVCSAYGSKLATYDQIEDAYNNGADWCNYGWSDGQMAFFPTQKSTWQKLQKTTDHKNDCGRPGVNGGYFANPYIKFGVNCYGKKPLPSNDDLDRMNVQKNYVYPKNAKDVELDKKVQFWKDNADKLLKVNSHNKEKWSEY